jgi:hypothetical protein
LDGTSDTPEVPEDATHLNQAGNSGNLRDVGADQLGGLLVDVTLATLAVVLLEMGEGRSRRDWVHVAVPMIVKRDVHEGVIGQSKDNVTDVSRF